VVDKRKVRRSIKDLQRVKTWQLIILLILALFVAATFLRLNNIGMNDRRAAVIVADQTGEEETTITRLYDLQQYVSSHMNTDLGRGVYLESSYNRALQAWQANQFGDRNPNGNIYQLAQEICAPQFTSFSAAYLQCTTNELAKFPAAADPTNGAGKPRQETYIYSFSSPLWSPDFAGWSVLICLVISMVIVARLVSLGILKLLLRKHYQSV